VTSVGRVCQAVDVWLGFDGARPVITVAMGTAYPHPMAIDSSNGTQSSGTP
jgi:hypothetical protein